MLCTNDCTFQLCVSPEVGWCNWCSITQLWKLLHWLIPKLQLSYETMAWSSFLMPDLQLMCATYLLEQVQILVGQIFRGGLSV